MTAFGLLASSLLSLTPHSPFTSTPRSQVYPGNRRLSAIQEADENAARKGSIVDDGVVISQPDEKSSLEGVSIEDSREKKEK